MPLVDRRSNSIVLRIVYDGPPSAGKATNLGYLCERLALTRPGTSDRATASDRSQFLDWLDVTGGWAGGERVRCQIVIVPGQIVLARRRRHILESADAVVFVADARPAAAPETTAALRSLARGLSGRADVPLVLQANKQDLSEAQEPWQLHEALGLAARVPAVAASAAIGDGVVESFLHAVRLAVDHVRALLVAGELGDEAGGAVELRRALDAGAPEAFDELDAVARAADDAIGRSAGGAPAQAPKLTVVTDPAEPDEPEHSDNPPGEAPTRPIRVIRCAPVRTTTTAEARAMIDAAMHATLPVLQSGRIPVPMRSVAIGSLAVNKSIAPPPVPVENSEVAANRDAATRPLRMNRFTPAKAILTGSAATAASTAPTGPIPIPILAPPSAVAAPASAHTAVTVPIPIIASSEGTLADPPVIAGPTTAATLVAVVAVEAHAIEAVTIEPVAIDAITIEREAVEPAPSAAPVVPQEPFICTDDDPTWELPAVDPSPPVVGASLESTILEAIARQDEPTAPIELVPPEAVTAPTAEAAVDAPVGEPAVAAPPVAEAPATNPPAEPRIETAAATHVANGAPAAPQPFQLPPVDLPAGMVWPGVSGRAALAAIAAPARIVERPAPWAPAHAIELACGEGWSAHTSSELVFAELERGKPALFEAVRWQAKLDALTPPGRTYALSPERDRVRLWVLTPAYRTVWAAIEEAFARGDRAAAGRLARIGLAAVDELRARGVAIADLDHIAVDDPSRLLATPWTERSDRLILQLQQLFAAAVL
jgi:signal recognition particle receptor subunit beta